MLSKEEEERKLKEGCRRLEGLALQFFWIQLVEESKENRTVKTPVFWCFGEL